MPVTLVKTVKMPAGTMRFVRDFLAMDRYSVVTVWNQVARNRSYGERNAVKVQFCRIATEILEEDVAFCDNCGDPAIDFGNAEDADIDPMCDDCFSQNYGNCNGCDRVTSNDDLRSIDYDMYCEDCVSYCDYCEEYYSGDHDCPADEDHSCWVAHRDFTFAGIQNDDRHTVTLGAGTINEDGIRKISQLVTNTAFALDMEWSVRQELALLVNDLDPRWQTREGNFPKRLQRALFKEKGFRATPELVSKIGNVAREHSSNETSYEVEVTRNLNLPAAEFVHESSCWWTNYRTGMCAFKQNGGIGLRVFSGDNIIGRVWILPLNGQLEPAHDGTHGYVVFNTYAAYGHDATIHPRAMARIVAQLSGRSYKKIDFSGSPMYVNPHSHLVADVETLSNIHRLDVTVPTTCY